MLIQTYYLTKYVLTQGIIEFTGKLTDCGKYVSEDRATVNRFFARVDKDAFESLLDAQTNALERAVKNVASKKKGLRSAEALLTKIKNGDLVIVRRTD